MSHTVTPYSREEMECLQRHVRRNLSIWIGLREFLKDYDQTMEEIIGLWGPFAEEIHSEKDLVNEHFGHAA